MKQIKVGLAIGLIVWLIGLMACKSSTNRNEKVRTITHLNQLKNRHVIPDPDLINRKVTLETILNGQDNPGLLNEDSAVTVEGYLLRVKQEKGESCNGYSTHVDDWDYHLYLVSDTTDTHIAQSMVVEVTPYTRSIHPEFTLKNLRKLNHKKVRVTGWLMYDYEHLDVSAGAHPDLKRVYRKSVYEIHPVTNIEEVNPSNAI